MKELSDHFLQNRHDVKSSSAQVADVVHILAPSKCAALAKKIRNIIG